jgi:hypothetical protein
VQKRRATYACALILLTLLALTQVLHSAASKLTIVPRAKLCITEGAIEESPNDALLVAVPNMRAYLNAFTSQLVDAHVTFLGSTGNEARRRTSPPIRFETSRTGCLQPRLCHVAH